MSYGKHWTVTAKGKQEPTELTWVAEIWEKDFTGYEDEIPCGYKPFQMQAMASSDNPFDPILASTLSITVDLTDYTGDLPDFTTLDDRKYWVKLYADLMLVWQGFILMDDTQVRFTTGFRALTINCIDGLAILKNILYEPTDPDINVLETLRQVMWNCLDLVELPDTFYLHIGVNYYADGMSTGESSFSQIYYPPRNWLNSDLTYMSCYDVLRTIAESFGSQIFTSGGNFYIASVNERFETNLHVFRSTNYSDPETQDSPWIQREILPYDLSNPTNSPFFFQQNVQTKIQRKGFAQLTVSCPTDYAPQFLDNGNMERLDGLGFPEQWDIDGGATINVTSIGPYTALTIVSSPGVASVRNEALGNGKSGDTLSVSFIAVSDSLSNPGNPFLHMYITFTAGVTTYYLSSENKWETSNFFYAWYDETTQVQRPYSLTTPPLPADADNMLIIMEAQDGITSFANVVITYNSPYTRREISTPPTETMYKKEVSVVMGGATGVSSNQNYAQRGALVDSSGDPLIDWYREGMPLGIFDSLIDIVAQQIYNASSRSQINFSLTLRNVYDDRSSVIPPLTPHIIGLLHSITVQDTTTDSMSVNGKVYIAGALTFNYTDDLIIGTMLETANEDIEVEFTDQNIKKA